MDSLLLLLCCAGLPSPVLTRHTTQQNRGGLPPLSLSRTPSVVEAIEVEIKQAGEAGTATYIASLPACGGFSKYPHDDAILYRVEVRQQRSRTVRTDDIVHALENSKSE